LFVLREPLAILTFERGVFSRVATGLTAGAVSFYSICLVGVTLGEIVVRFFYASRDMRTPLLSGGVRMVVNLIPDIILAIFLGLKELPLLMRLLPP
jgi:putative peptidoglycan lipid II flippase